MSFDERPTHESAPASDTRAAWSVALRHIGLVATVEIALVLVCAGKACSQDEAFILRWMRICADHPMRTGAALLLGCEALRRRRADHLRPEGRGERPLW
jgi:hypothetical protein